MRPWTVGDNVNLAVGQGDLQATPLQMAVAYSAIANGGRVVRPHLGLAIEDRGELRASASSRRRAPREASTRPTARRSSTACARAASEPGGTSADVFTGWPAALPGLRQDRHRQRRHRQHDQSWYVAYVPDAAPRRSSSP